MDAGSLCILAVVSSASVNKGHRRAAVLYGSSDYDILKRLSTIIMMAAWVYTPINIALRFSCLFVLIFYENTITSL